MKLNFLVTTISLFGFIAIFSACKDDPTCFDGIQNQGELGVDCCGPCDSACVNIQNCTEVIATCSDGIQNGNETGIDCGGDCDPCESTPTCTDGIQNGDETGVDCGGSCDPCESESTSITLNFNGTDKAFSESNISASTDTDGNLTIVATKLDVVSGTETLTLTIPANLLVVGTGVIGTGNTIATYTSGGDLCSNSVGTLIIATVTSNSLTGSFSFDCTFSDGTTAGEAVNGALNNITW